ncbi:hypothetical protein GCM10020254_02400 [Streptomyces goshikiensis]
MATEMYRRMIAGAQLPPGATWQERLLSAQRDLRRALLGYRDGAKVFSGSRFTGTEHAAAMETTLRACVEAGFELSQAVRALSTAFLFTLGHVTEEQGVQPLPGERREGFDVEERAARMAGFPLAAAAGADLFQGFEEGFEEGVRLVIAGIEARYGV